MRGDYNHVDTFAALRAKLPDSLCPVAFLAVPPSLFDEVATGLAGVGMNSGRIIVEKPFGRDLASSEVLRASQERTYRAIVLVKKIKEKKKSAISPPSVSTRPTVA